jgi:tRNA-dihydrouridine synthase A
VALRETRALRIPLSVAPMMDRTDRHLRYFLRLLTRHTLLYTEMITTPAILLGDRPRHLDYSAEEHPLALQLGGDDPQALAACAKIAEDWGYDEVNLNVGCPSDRVQSGRFGACLMATPERVADAVRAMRQASRLPITVKHRIGIDGLETYEHMRHFVDVVAEAGCDRFSVHARIAILAGLSPAENRTIPPLRYADVYRLKAERPDLLIELNGGVRTLAQAQEALAHVDAVMIGRAAYEDTWVFAQADRLIFGEPTDRFAHRRAAVEALLPYIERERSRGTRLHHVARHLLALFQGLPGTKVWKRVLSEEGMSPTAGPEVLLRALDAMPEGGPRLSPSGTRTSVFRSARRRRRPSPRAHAHRRPAPGPRPDSPPPPSACGSPGSPRPAR